jgi:hypothetical protein
MLVSVIENFCVSEMQQKLELIIFVLRRIKVALLKTFSWKRYLENRERLFLLQFRVILMSWTLYDRNINMLDI